MLNRLRAVRPLGVICCVALLSACAGLNNVTSQVSTYGQWPAGREPGAYVFERLPSQMNQPDLQTRLEDAARPALADAGFREVAEAGQADVVVQIGAQERVDIRRRYDPYWGPYPFGWGWGGWWGGRGRGGVALGMSMEPNWVQMQVDLLIRDRRTQGVLYETHAVHDRVGSGDDRLWPFLFEAALKDFPLPAVSPRTVTVPVDAAAR